MGATQMTSGQLRVGHVNRWLAARPFNEAKSLSGRMIYQTTNFKVVGISGQVAARPSGTQQSLQASALGTEHVELKKQPQKVTHLIQARDFASFVREPKQLMSDLMASGWIDAHGMIADNFFGLTEPSKMNLPLSYDPVSKDVFALLQAARNNYYKLYYDMVMNEHAADSPLTLFRAIDGVFSDPGYSASIHDAWTGRGGEMRHDFLLHILSVETPTIDQSIAIERMNAWFTDSNHCPVWAQPGQPPIFHSYDFKASGDDKSGMDPHTDEPVGNVLKRTHHFRLAAPYFIQIVSALENIGKHISRGVNVKPSEDSQIRPWNHSSQVAFMLDVLGHARFGTPNIREEGA